MNRLAVLSLEYEIKDGLYWESMGWSNTTRTDNLTFVAHNNDIDGVLQSKSYYGYPLMIDTTSVTLSTEIDVGEYIAVVSGEETLDEYECWKCKIGSQTTVFYEVATRLLIGSRSLINGTTDYTDWMTTKNITLIDFRTDFIEEIYPATSGILISGVFLELAAVAWLLGNRYKSPE